MTLSEACVRAIEASAAGCGGAVLVADFHTTGYMRSHPATQAWPRPVSTVCRRPPERSLPYWVGLWGFSCRVHWRRLGYRRRVAAGSQASYDNHKVRHQNYGKSHSGENPDFRASRHYFQRKPAISNECVRKLPRSAICP
jgi:hypothetical protein